MHKSENSHLKSKFRVYTAELCQNVKAEEAHGVSSSLESMTEKSENADLEADPLVIGNSLTCL